MASSVEVLAVWLAGEACGRPYALPEYPNGGQQILLRMKMYVTDVQYRCFELRPRF